ncbi:multi-sensor signal transduction histidine kinase [Candidatus Omnitrophus magneticus]|uniref:histidine kinase n=1 Tax=Candidatus Omnitrophus magneticus TaxID=1609969 RepID=A0A0F0CL09_9BACT|nr:multi-sensor signal transduction histidine kinase [Candidatus Omnitrophus magneticus]
MEDVKSYIIIVEDSAIQREMLKRLLIKEGYQVLAARDGLEGLSVIKGTSTRLVISDIVMPNMDGFELCNKIKNDDDIKHIGVILLTELSDPNEIIKGLSAGADNYITKPYNKEYLLSCVKDFMSGFTGDSNPKDEMTITYNGVDNVIRASREQTMNLLLYTYENAVQKNRELIKTQLELKTLNEQLEEKVAQRTRELADSESSYRCLLENTISGFYRSTLDGKFLLVNPTYVKMLGFNSKEELLKVHIPTILYHKSSDYDSFIEELYNKNFIENRVIELKKKDKSKVIFSENIHLVRNSSNIPIYCEGFVNDITARVQMEEALRRSKDYLAQEVKKRTAELELTNEQLKQEIVERKRAEEKKSQLLEELSMANQELKEITYASSHDLKTPLRAIGSLASWLSSDYSDKFDQDGKEHIKMLIDRVSRMNDLVDGIMQFSGMRQIKYEKQRVNLYELLNDILIDVSPPDNIEVNISKTLPTIDCEKVRIELVFKHLIHNAINFMDKLKGIINVGSMRKDDSWVFSVSDNGPGIETKYFSKIFGIFQTLGQRDELKTTGIGLTLVKKIVETNEGKVYLESEVGVGTTFYFTLPYQRD